MRAVIKGNNYCLKKKNEPRAYKVELNFVLFFFLQRVSLDQIAKQLPYPPEEFQET